MERIMLKVHCQHLNWYQFQNDIAKRMNMLRHEFNFTHFVIILALLEHFIHLHWYQIQNDNLKTMNTLKTWILFHPSSCYPCSLRASKCLEMESVVLKVHRYYHCQHLYWYQFQNDNAKRMNTLKAWILFHPSCYYPCPFRASECSEMKRVVLKVLHKLLHWY
jgi:hypothetical protein